MQPRSTGIRFRVDPRDVPAEKAARRLHLTPAEFHAKLPELTARGFPRPDPTTTMFDVLAIDAWMTARHSSTATPCGLTGGAKLRNAQDVFGDLRGRHGGQGKIRYLLFKKGRWRWRPTKTMRMAGFTPVRLGLGLIIDGERFPGSDDIARARQLNQDWDRHRHGLARLAPIGRYPTGSIGDGFERAIRLRGLERSKKGIVWAKEQHSRDDWTRVWKRIERIAPLLAECDPKTVTPGILLDLCTEVADTVSASEAYRLIKVWRALWKKMATFGFCDLDRDPSHLFANSAPAPRQAVWREGEVVRLVKAAWRKGYKGLAAWMSVAWDSQLSQIPLGGISSLIVPRQAVVRWALCPGERSACWWHT